MEAPAVTRRRRPFLAPLWLILLAALALMGIAWSSYRTAGTTIVVLVRCPDKQPGTIADPPLSAEGEARAQRLARLFGAPTGAAGIAALYATDDRRAQQTIAPLAARLHHAPVLINTADIGAAGARLLREHAGGTVLLVGGGNSVSQLAQWLAGGDADKIVTADAEAAYLVSIPSLGHAQLLRISF